MLWPGIIPVLSASQQMASCSSLRWIWLMIAFNISGGKNGGNIQQRYRFRRWEAPAFISIAGDSQFSNPNSLINFIFVPECMLCENKDSTGVNINGCYRLAAIALKSIYLAWNHSFPASAYVVAASSVDQAKFSDCYFWRQKSKMNFVWIIWRLNANVNIIHMYKWIGNGWIRRTIGAHTE